jgi:hypothetical protein
MKTHRWIPQVVTQAPAVPVEKLTGTQRIDPLLEAARRIVIPALVLGSLGAGAAGLAQVNANQSVGTTHVASSTSPDRTGPGTWIY